MGKQATDAGTSVFDVTGVRLDVTAVRRSFEPACGGACAPILLGLKEAYGRKVGIDQPQVCLHIM